VLTGFFDASELIERRSRVAEFIVVDIVGCNATHIDFDDDVGRYC